MGRRVTCKVLSAILGAAGLLSAGPGSALAAEITFNRLFYSADRFVPQFHLEGPVIEGDAAALTAIVDSLVECAPAAFDREGGNCAVLTLNSPGGDYHEGLRLAAVLRERAIATVVEETAECYSACAFAFLGGSGHSPQDGIGDYIDRMIEPGARLGFHAPYFAPESLDGLVAQLGLDNVLGASRDGISLMIRQLVNWNVNANVLGHVVSMGPSETYDIVSGQDYFLLWAQLPPAPLYYWNSNSASALRNACINLLAQHQNTWPEAVMAEIPFEAETGLAINESGQSLAGFRLAQRSPLGVSFCALPEEQADLGGDIDLALYTAPGLSGAARPVLSLFNRAEGWSTMGTGGEPTRRHMQKGSMSHVFVDVGVPVESDFVNFMDYLPLRKFTRFDGVGLSTEPPLFPTSRLALSVSGENDTIRLMALGRQQVIVQAGSGLLYATAQERLESGRDNRRERDAAFTLQSEKGFSVSGFHFSGRPFLWLGLKGDDGTAAIVRIETPFLPTDMEAAIAEQDAIACAFQLQGNALECS